MLEHNEIFFKNDAFSKFLYQIVFFVFCGLKFKLPIPLSLQLQICTWISALENKTMKKVPIVFHINDI